MHFTAPMQGSAWSVLLLTFLAAAVLSDCRSQRIPNVLSVGLLLTGIAAALHTRGLPGLPTALAGAGTGFLALLPFYALGGFGAGDVKLMTAVGAWFSVELAAWTAAYTLLAGGALGLAVALWSLRRTMGFSVSESLTAARLSPRVAMAGVRGVRFPFAIAIAAGTLATMRWGSPL
jgi:prepilin peptidase CpaA